MTLVADTRIGKSGKCPQRKRFGVPASAGQTCELRMLKTISAGGNNLTRYRLKPGLQTISPRGNNLKPLLQQRVRSQQGHGASCFCEMYLMRRCRFIRICHASSPGTELRGWRPGI